MGMFAALSHETWSTSSLAPRSSCSTRFSSFQGLSISLMAGEVASLLLSRMAVPVLYYMAKRHERSEPVQTKAPMEIAA